MKKLIPILFICYQSFGFADLNNDAIVNFLDFQIFANEWQKTSFTDPNCDFNADSIVDYKDLSVIASEWLGNYLPEANDVNETAWTYITKTITFPVEGQIYIVSSPNDSNCYLEDSASGVGLIGKWPHRLRGDLWFAADANKTYSFKWKFNNGHFDSCDVNCFVTVSPNPKDCLQFENGGTVIMDDNSLLDLEPNRGIGFCFYSQKPFCTLLTKHETGKAGYEIKLQSGKIRAEVYSATELVAVIDSDNRYDNKWVNCVLGYSGTALELYTGFGNPLTGEPNWLDDGEMIKDEDAVLLTGDFSNDCNVVFDSGKIDAFRAYNLSFADVFRTLSAAQIRESAGNTQTYVPNCAVRFKCNESSGATIADDVNGLVGNLSDANIWNPKNPFWADINVQQYYFRKK